jgi:hypothetical protein
MGPDKLRRQLKEAYRRLLTPLMRILIRNGVTVTEAIDLTRRAFVDAATSSEFRLPGRRISDTRVAILTGLTRKEVSELRSEAGLPEAGTNLSRIVRLVSAWNQDPDFTGPYGLPVAIKFDSGIADSPLNFTELVRRHSPGISPRAMLDELLRTGLAHVDDEGWIRNSGRAYIPSKLDPAAVERIGQVLGRLAETVDFNNQVTEASLGRFERVVMTDIGLTDEQYRQFNVYLRAQCQQFLETIDNWLATKEDRLNAYQSQHDTPRKRIMTGLGVYHFIDEDVAEELKELESSPFEEEEGDV